MLELNNREVMQISKLHSELTELGLEPRRPLGSKLFIPKPDHKYFIMITSIYVLIKA